MLPTIIKAGPGGWKAAGYATAPDYAQRLIRIIEESKLYLLDREDGLTITERKPDTSPTTGSRAKATSIKPQRSLRGRSIPTTTA